MPSPSAYNGGWLSIAITESITMQLKISQRIGLGLLIVVGLLTTLLVVTSISVSQYRTHTQTLTNNMFPQLQHLSLLRATTINIASETVVFVINQNNDDLSERKKAVNTAARLVTELRQLHLAYNHDAAGENIDALATTIDALVLGTDSIIQRQQSGEQLDDYQVVKQADTLNEAVAAAIGQIEGEFQSVEQTAIQGAEFNPLIPILGMGSIAVLMTIATLIVLVRTVSHPLQQMRDTTLAIAAGALDHQVDVTRGDEIGDLGRAFNIMISQISQQQQALELRVQEADAAQQRAETARTAITEQLVLINQQRVVIREMSVPILPLSSTALMMPLVGELDSERLQHIQEQVLAAIERSRSRYLILDITGVPIIDTAVAQGLQHVVQAAQLLGTQVLLVGIRPEVAQTIVGLGIQLNSVTTMSSLQSGIAYVFRQSHALLHERLEARD